VANRLADLNAGDFTEVLHKHLVSALKELDCAGSVAGEYSLYDALDREVLKAHKANRRLARVSRRRAREYLR
jgi:hypothetical protein